MSVEPETDVDNDPEPESDRAFDPEVLEINRAVKLIKKLSPEARVYVLARCK